jgi:UDP-4-amino-4,6-dideoxy-N-acetyl-beta-L-altrosamine transaminase
MGMIPYGRHAVSGDDERAVLEVLRSDFLTQGPAVPRFERAMAERVGAAHAVAVNSATSALHIACLALGLGPGDLLWTVPNTFLASANCARYCGADVDFVDIDARSRNMSAAALADKLQSAATAGRLPKVVVPVHFSGLPCDMAEIHQLSRRYGFFVIEDASHAVGARYQGSHIGDCRHSDITVLSFHPVKIITTAEGGMGLTNDPELARRMEMLRSHGMERDPARFVDAPEGPWVYEMQELGYNYRLTDLHAALGVSQLDRLDEILAARAAVAAGYDTLLAGLPVIRPEPVADRTSAWHLYVIELGAVRATRAEVFATMRAAGIGVAVHYIPVHLQPYYRALKFKPGDFPQAEAYYGRCITLPLYPTLTPTQQAHVVQALKSAVS